MFYDAGRREQGGARMGYTGRNGEVISSIDVIGGFSVGIGWLIKEGYFKVLVSNYNYQAWGVMPNENFRGGWLGIRGIRGFSPKYEWEIKSGEHMDNHWGSVKCRCLIIKACDMGGRWGSRE